MLVHGGRDLALQRLDLLVDRLERRKLSTNARRVASSSAPIRVSGARRSFTSSFAGVWRPV
jgi:hypothetical protein